MDGIQLKSAFGTRERNISGINTLTNSEYRPYSPQVKWYRPKYICINFLQAYMSLNWFYETHNLFYSL
jgi:hypothetical protein